MSASLFNKDSKSLLDAFSKLEAFPEDEKIKLQSYLLKASDFINKSSSNAEQCIFKLEQDREDIEKHLNSILSNDFLCGFTDNAGCKRCVVVYFVPGRNPSTSFSKNWNQAQKLIIGEHVNKLNIRLARHLFHHHTTGDIQFNHLFEFSHEVFRQGITAGGTEFCQSLLVERISTSPHQIGRCKWDVRRDVVSFFGNESLIVTAVVITEEGLVILACYYDDLMIDLKRKTRIKKDFEFNDDLKSLIFQSLRYINEAFSRQVLARFYTPLVKFNRQMLQEALQRTNISESFLHHAGERLNDKANFTYYFEHPTTKDKICCADLGQVIRHELLEKYETIFETVRKIENSIYSKLWKPLCNLPILQNTIWKFPATLEKMKLVQDIEYWQRSLELSTRDHVIHPFQTFLLGTLIINEQYNEFVQPIAHDMFGKDAESLSADESSAVKAFMKSAWFVCSTMHDIGYPVQVFDDVTDALRSQVANLLNLEPESLCQPLKLRIDRVIYDDPRTALVLRRLSYGLYTLLDIPPAFLDKYGPDYLKQTIYWLIRHIAFEKKNHDLVSTIALALSLLKAGTTEPDMDVLNALAKEPTCKDDLDLIEKHILLPVMLHHITGWEKEADEMMQQLKKKMKENKDPQKVVKYKTMIKAIDAMIGLFGINKACHLIRPECPLIKFQDVPFVVLLSICDFFQEWGRPGGKKKDRFPSRIEGQLAYDEDGLNLSVYLTYAEETDFDYTLPLMKSDYEERIARLESLEWLYERGPLKNLYASFSCNIPGTKPIILMRKSPSPVDVT